MPDWREITGWFDESEAAALRAVAAKIPAGQCAVELGSYCGRSAAAVASVLPDGVPLYCVDIWEGAPTDSFTVGCARRNGWMEALAQGSGHHIGMSALEFETNLEELGLLHTKVIPIVRDSCLPTDDLDLPPIGLLFIDADHSQEQTAATFRAWQPRLAPSATVFFHDYKYFDGVPKAIAELGLQVEAHENLAMWKAA